MAVINLENVQYALNALMGTETKINSWITKDFTKVGDNYATKVTSIEIKFQNERNYISELCAGKEKAEKTDDSNLETVSFVAKMLPERTDGPFKKVLENLHEREGKFLTVIAPRINSVLRSLKADNLAIPKCYFASYGKRKELLINEDMRIHGYKMVDRKIGMNANQLELIVKELAKLHAASYILRKQNDMENFNSTYPFIIDLFREEDVETAPFYEIVYKGNIEGSVKLLNHVGGYEAAIEWLKDLYEKILPSVRDQICNVQDKFKVLCHGDTWNNNFIFNSSSVCLLDLQVCRFSSLATDLTYLFYTSVTTTTRRILMPRLLTVYYQAYETLLTSANYQMEFSADELQKEVLRCQLWGLVAAMLIIPTVVLESEDSYILNSVADEQLKTFREQKWNDALTLLDKNEFFKDRFLGVFDDAVASGLISKSSQKLCV